MMRLKPSLKNSTNPALRLLSLSLIILFVFGCSSKIEPTYKEQDIPFHIKKICKEEYNLEVTTAVVGQTLWVYAPLHRILNKDFAVTKDNILDEEMINKLRNIMTSIGRVLISSDRAPQFYCLVISDVKEVGLDYILIGNVLDTKKSYAGFIPWPETNKRYVVKLESAPQALGDTTGWHIKPYDISETEFIAGQISQRIKSRFKDDDYKDLYKIKSIDVQFTPTTIVINADMERQEMRLSRPKNEDIFDESLKIVALLTRAYDFKDFLDVEINDIRNGKSRVFSRSYVETIKE